MQDTRGFSLVEIVVVVGIISLLGSVSVATYIAYRDQADFTSTHTSLLQLIESARHQARTGVADTSWSLELESDRITLFAGTDYATRDDSLDHVLLLPPDTTLTGPDTVTFLQVTGYPDPPASYELQSGDDNVEITINTYGTVNQQN